MSYSETEIVDPAFLVTADVTNEIFTERIRQMRDEGFTYEHDDSHNEGELIRAAVSYSLVGCPGASETQLKQYVLEEGVWPSNWNLDWFKLAGARRNLIKAAALLIAEIERIDRLEKSKA